MITGESKMAFLASKSNSSHRDQAVRPHELSNLIQAGRMLQHTRNLLTAVDSDAGEESDARQPESVAAVLKVFGILQALGEQRNIGISEISQRLAMPKATVYRFLQTMKGLGYVQQEQESERYGLSMRIFELGSKALQYPDLIQIADVEMRQLTARCTETTHLGALVDQTVSCIHKVDSPSMLGMNTRVGTCLPLHNTAIGKVLVAYSQKAMAEALLSGMEMAPVSTTSLREELDTVRQQGFAVNIQEYNREVCCLAVPVLDYLNNVVAGLSVTLPVFRYNPDLQGEYVSLLHQAARKISCQLGCTAYPF